MTMDKYYQLMNDPNYQRASLQTSGLSMPQAQFAVSEMQQQQAQAQEARLKMQAYQQQAAKQQQLQAFLNSQEAQTIDPIYRGFLKNLPPDQAIDAIEQLRKSQKDSFLMKAAQGGFGQGYGTMQPVDGAPGAAPMGATPQAAPNYAGQLQQAQAVKALTGLDNTPAIQYQIDQQKRAEDRALEQQRYKEKQDLQDQERNIPGLERIPNVRPDSTTVRSAREAITAKKRLDSSLTGLKDLISTSGAQAVPGTPERKRMDELIADIRNAERQLANSGVLNVGELPFLEQSYASFNPTSWGNALFSNPDQLVANLEDYQVRRSADFATMLEPLGYKIKDMPKTNKASGGGFDPAKFDVNAALAEARRRGLVK